eukprot:s4313_g9.t1
MPEVATAEMPVEDIAGELDRLCDAMETEAVAGTRAAKEKLELQLMSLSMQAKKGWDLALLQHSRGTLENLEQWDAGGPGSSSAQTAVIEQALSDTFDQC